MKVLVISHSIYVRVHALAHASGLVSDPGKNCVLPAIGSRISGWGRVVLGHHYCWGTLLARSR